jgi:hypothetical protein
MANKLFRCEAEGCTTGVFEAPKGVCPGCAASAADGDPVVELVPVHYLVPDKAGPIRTKIGRRSVACDPKSARLPQASGDRDAVTCPKCRASALFAAHEDGAVSNHDPMIEKIAAEKLGAN